MTQVINFSDYQKSPTFKIELTNNWNGELVVTLWGITLDESTRMPIVVNLRQAADLIERAEIILPTEGA